MKSKKYPLLPVGSVLYQVPTDHRIEEFLFECSGCNLTHSFRTKSPTGDVWIWNKSLTNPTLDKSLFLAPNTNHQCHLMIIDGYLHYHKNCWHSMRSQIVKMVEIV